MFKKPGRNTLRKKRHRRIRTRVTGTVEKPRLCIYRSLQHIYAQLVDDITHHTLVTASTLEEELRDMQGRNTIDGARAVGELLAQKALEQGITEVVFDRSGYRFHGRVAALAEAAREGGLKF
ncbi:MAG: 50S ribosomal protein L18 [Syntrophomonadaceae bacterium]|nr:50S ribosomal protein L18 [Syntrophomonadaceae bacterium]